ncbi:GNAT family N-acetyltransferase [Paenibacillus sp. MMS18-CY102]|uniref:GNAT family N-acetyltransferase n=1 Tax=Paenibacillus sp. MMS18-CY102 TaxID=2682849 RepID=UPI001365292B|nr:GNAT family N-acetyltransferase [Paenibacillus sp. MMS18-CY102]MWC30249.1 GNAT family N-acetyltransferase [Paenibacillus sp. MMS18-CY102]
MECQPCSIDAIQHLMDEYLQGLSSPFDSFLEEHILSSAFYVITDESGEIGYFAIHPNELLTQFYISRSSLMHAQAVFGQIMGQYAIKSLFVPTCDELLISLMLDNAFTANLQAYFFQDGRVYTEESSIRDHEVFRVANPDDLPQVQSTCGDFLDAYERRIANGEIFVYYRGADLLGIGIAEQSKLLPGTASIGMFVGEAFRKQGVGTAIIVALRQWCASRGIRPISGCWYYNEHSKKTLEKAGMVTRTRLLNVQTNQGAEGTEAEGIEA